MKAGGPGNVERILIVCLSISAAESELYLTTMQVVRSRRVAGASEYLHLSDLAAVQVHPSPARVGEAEDCLYSSAAVAALLRSEAAVHLGHGSLCFADPVDLQEMEAVEPQRLSQDL